MLVLGLGSNLGDRETSLKRAVHRLSRGRNAVLTDVKLSRVYESAALMPDGAPADWDLPYLNCALVGRTALGPFEVLARIKDIETSLGRRRGLKWEPRTIDIDILWWGERVIQGEDLTIPHPEILNRSFVLEPLRDLIPDERLGGATFREHARRSGRGRNASRARASSEADFRVRYPDLMGILNVTPDSFSDGGRFGRPEDALDHARRLVEAGASIIDVGAESTRPAGLRVDPAEEWARLEPVLRGLKDAQSEQSFRISLDSRNPTTVRSAMEVGIDLINDVTGFSRPQMLEIAQDTDLPLVFMHSLSVPVVKGEFLPQDRDPVQFLVEWAQDRLETFDRNGIDRSRLIFDPGIGFGKTTRQNWHILSHMAQFHDLGTPLLVSHSRKSFFDSITNKPSAERDPETLAVSDTLSRYGVEIIRVHNVVIHDAHFRAQFAGSSLRLGGLA